MRTVTPATIRTTLPDTDGELPANTHPALVVISGSLIGLRAEITTERFMIGRSVDAHLSIPTAKVSREHCLITAELGALYIEDLGSTNKTYLNDAFLTERRTLHDGDLIKIGDCVLKYFATDSIEISYQKQLLDLAVTDALTGLCNRRQFLLQFQARLSDSNARNTLLSLILMDLDFFKSINDRFGHLEGDVVLAACGQLLQKELPRTATAGRIGGEEFAILLPNMSIAQAHEVAEQLRIKLHQMVIPLQSTNINISASFGCAEWSSTLNTSSTLMRAADEKLYLAKDQGRNCVR